MEFDLNDLVQTLAVGGFVLYGLYTLYCVFVPEPACGENDPADKSLFGPDGLPIKAVFVAVCFAIGLIMEGVGSNLPDELTALSNKDQSCWRKLVGKLTWPVTDSSELRARSLFKVTEITPEHFIGEPKPLFKELLQFADPPPQLASYKTNLTGGQLNLDNWTNVYTNDVKGYLRNVDVVFFTAKNRVFREDNYHSELMDLQRRFSFARAFLMSCYFLSVPFAALALLSLCKQRPKWLKLERPLKARIWLLCGGCVAGLFLARAVYIWERGEFNKRVVGYYTSLKTDPSEAPTEKKENPQKIHVRFE